jgi:hypothetical protein
MSDINPRTLNELFLQRVETDREKVAQESGAFVRTKLREVSFARKVINPEYVTKADCQRSLNHDGLVKIVDIEPDSAAIAMSFRGEPNRVYVEGDRFEIAFFNIASDKFQKNEEELLAYEMPVTEIIERNSVKDIQKIEDTTFINAINTAIASSGKTVSHTLTTSGIMEVNAFTKLFNTLEESSTGSNPLKTDVLLMNQADFNKLVSIPATSIGSPAASEMFVNGYAYSTFLGKKLIVTNKGDLVPEGTIYAFPSQEFIGKYYILNDTKFWIEKRMNVISWAAYETIGMGIGNIKAVASLTITNA